MLGFIPENRTIKLFSVSKPDKFGVSVEDKVGKEHDCYFSFNTDNEKTVNPLGEEVVYTATMLFNNSENIKIKAGDKVEFTDDFEESQKKKVIKVQYKRDFAGKITSVKAVI